jgi:hypothetical protein
MVVLILLCGTMVVSAQEIRIHCSDQPLNAVLTQLRDQYGLMFSYDDKLLSGYRLTLDRRFSTPPEALNYLLKGLPLHVENINGVFVIYPVARAPQQKKYILAGRILDKSSRESLPYSALQINGKGLFADDQGVFSFISGSDSVFHVKISHLGYYILDTITLPGYHLEFTLQPSVIAMKEIVIVGKPVERTIQTGTAPGAITLNHKIAYYLPGYGDNSVFNLLRLQPGILAAGEQSADLMIWGGYAGQSQVLFDGFTLFGMKNFNDNISAINPYMAKDIKVFKGAFGAEYGEKVGAIADIRGADGNRMKPAFQLVLNNMTLNAFASVPLGKKSSLVTAYRQTYYALYDPFSITSSSSSRGRQTGGADYYIVPDYTFRDFNLKYSGEGKRSSYFISLYGGTDDFGYGTEQETARKKISLHYQEDNLQAGATGFYGFRWKEANTLHVAISYSGLNTDRDYREVIERTAGNLGNTTVADQTTNALHEIHSRVVGQFLAGPHRIEAGAGALTYITRNHLHQVSDSFAVSRLVPYLYAQDNLTLVSNITLKPGIRTDFPLNGHGPLFQPRLSASWHLGDHILLNAAWGVYRQTASKTLILDTTANYRLFWTLREQAGAFRQHAVHYSAGMTWAGDNLSASIEGYLKYTGGITRFLQTGSGYVPYTGQSRTRGLDFFLKKDLKNLSFWFAYTWSKTEEAFPYFADDDYKPAMHDQRHELKVAALAKIRAFHFSADYVVGTGFPDPEQLPQEAVYQNPYSRLDVSALVQLLNRKLHLDAGISVLNVLNTENINYANYTRIREEESSLVSFYAEGVPVTPALFVKIYF